MSILTYLKEGAEHAESQTKALCWLEVRAKPAGILVRVRTEKQSPYREYRRLISLEELNAARVNPLPITIDHAVRSLEKEAA